MIRTNLIQAIISSAINLKPIQCAMSVKIKQRNVMLYTY